jgi:hypothetical protein
MDEELCACFIDWRKALDRVNRTISLQILKNNGIDWSERKLCMDQSVELRVGQGVTRSVKIGSGVRQDAVCHCNLYSKHLNKEGLDRFGDFKIGRKLIRMVKYADDLC